MGRSSRREYSANPNRLCIGSTSLSLHYPFYSSCPTDSFQFSPWQLPLFCSRSRERYRERDGGRSQQEGSLRSSSRGHEGGGSAQAVAPAGGSSPTVVLAGSRTFSGGNLPTILQPRERAADEDSTWDSGDASSIGDPEFDGTRQHGPRGSGSKSSSSRQLVERREREGAARREGKWERKQHS